MVEFARRVGVVGEGGGFVGGVVFWLFFYCVCCLTAGFCENVDDVFLFVNGYRFAGSF